MQRSPLHLTKLGAIFLLEFFDSAKVNGQIFFVSTLQCNVNDMTRNETHPG